MGVAKTAFLTALTAPAGSATSVTASVAAVNSTSTALVTAAGKVGAYGIDATNDIYGQLQDFLHSTNKLGVATASTANSLNWAANAFNKQITFLAKKSTIASSDIAGAQRYLTGKLSVYNPSNLSKSAADLSDDLTAYTTTITASIATVQTNLTQLKSAVKDAQKQLDSAHSKAEAARILTGVGQFVGSLCDAAAIIAATKASQAEKVAANAKNQEMQEDFGSGSSDRSGYQRIETSEERASRIQKSGITYLVGSGIGKIFGGVFDAAAAATAADVPGSDSLSQLRVQIDLLETNTIPLYENHIIPAMNSLVPSINTAVNQLVTVTNTWTKVDNDLSKLVDSFNAWSADSGYSHSDFVTSLNGLVPGWVAIQNATAAVTPSNSLLAAAAPKPRALLMVTNSVETGVLKVQTATLLDALRPLTPESTGLVSLPRANASITYNINSLTAIATTSPALKNVVDLAKTSNSLTVNIDSTLASVAYFIEKLESYTANEQLEKKTAAVLRTLGRKADSLSESIPDQVKAIKDAADSASTIATNISALVDRQTTEIGKAIVELQDQQKNVAAIVDEEKKKQASKSQKLSNSFKKMLTDGIFSQATLDFIATLLNIDNAADTKALDKAQTSLDTIGAAITKAQEESSNLQSSTPLLTQTNSGLSSVRIGFVGLAEGFGGTGKKLDELAKNINPDLVDWTVIDPEIPVILAGWKAFYNSISRTEDNSSLLRPIASSKLVIRRDTANKIISSRYPSAQDRLVSRTLKSAPAARTLTATAFTANVAESANDAPASVDEARKNIKNALAPAPGATVAVQDITDNIVTLRAKVTDMRKRLSASAYAADLVKKVVEFEKEYNALEVKSRTTAGQIYWFGQKNLKILDDLKTKATAGTLTVPDFQKDIKYLENKVAYFVTGSNDLTVEHKDLQTSISSISGALIETQSVLADLIPKMQARLDQAKTDLSKEKDKIKQAAILRAVGTGLSALGQGGGIFAVVKANMVVAGFAAGAAVVGGLMNLIAGCIDGDPNKVAELQASIAQLNAQIPDMKVAQDAIAPCLTDATDIQAALGNMSKSWQIVNNNLSNIDRDYKFWLTTGFVLDDFLFDVDDDVAAWTTVCNLLYKLAMQGGDGVDEDDTAPSGLRAFAFVPAGASASRAQPLLRAAAAVTVQENPVTRFQNSVNTLLSACTTTTGTTKQYANLALTGANNQKGPGADFTNFIKSLQDIGNQAFNGASQVDVLSRNASTDGGVASSELVREADLLSGKINEVNSKIYDAEHLSFWDKLRGFFEHFGQSIAGIFSGDVKKTFEGIGTIIAPFSAGITIAAINSVDDAKNFVNQLNAVLRQLQAQQQQVNVLRDLVNRQTAATQGLTNAVTTLRNTTQNLKLDLSPQEQWDDFILDKPDIIKNATSVNAESDKVNAATTAFPR